MTNRSDAAEVAANYVRTITADVERNDYADAAADYVDVHALDADYVVDSRGHVKGLHLIVGTGGPHVEVQHRIGAEVVQVRVWWWGDYADESVHAPHLAAELDGLGDAWQDANLHGAGVTR